MVIPIMLMAQRAVFNEIQSELNKGTHFESLSVFERSQATFEDLGIQKDELSQGTILELNKSIMRYIADAQPAYVSVEVELDGIEQTVLLKKHNILTDDFVLNSPEGELVYNQGVHYRGVLKGDKNSISAFSFFENEVMAVISYNENNVVIGQVEGARGQHILYDDKDLTNSNPFSCETEDDDVQYRPDQLDGGPSLSPGDCIRVYIQIDDDIVTGKGGATNATNYITGLFNQSITLYGNEQIPMSVSEIYAWTSSSPYSGSSSSQMLSSYQSNTGSFNGDLSHLVSYKASGGIAAGFSGICNSNPDYSKCFSSIASTYSVVPTYSWSVMVITHEMGHLIGSRHTHACVWNGNNTAIDGCAGGTEGSCSLPGYPSGGGTMMSYCHIQSVGINFNKGFGPQPGNVIRSTVNNASCLSSCNGGGGCTDNEVTFTLTFDNYASETSWNLKNASGTTIESGGGYGSAQNGTTITKTFCLADGCYDFTILDSYGDGICCSYGNGSYELKDASGTVLASGGQFGSSETKNICLNSAPPATCTDGIQNGQETGVDCGGPTCPACPLNYCTSKGNNSNYEYIDRIVLGSIDNTSGNNNGYADYRSLSTNLSRSGSTTMTLKPGFPGSTYTEYWRVWIDLNQDGDFNDSGELRLQGSGTSTLTGPLSIPSGAVNGSTTMRVSMKYGSYPTPCETFTYGEVEDYTVNILPSLDEDGGTDSAIASVYTIEGDNDFKHLEVYPVPSQGFVNVKFLTHGSQTNTLRILDIYGKEYNRFSFLTEREQQGHTVDISNLIDGVYFMELVQEGVRTTQRFVVVNK